MYISFGDTLSGALARAPGEDVGIYSILQGTLSNSNYAIAYTGANLTVGQRAITVAANSGQSKVYGNADPELTYAITSGTLVSGDAFSGVLSRAAGENVGSYAIGQGSLTLGGNYALTVTPGSSFGISPRVLLVTAHDVGKIYDGAAFSGGAGVAYAGFAAGENETALGGTLVYGGSSQGAVDVGSYSITVSGLTSANYAISYTPGTLIILPNGLPSDPDGLVLGPGLSKVTPASFVSSSPLAGQLVACGAGELSAVLNASGQGTLLDTDEMAACASQ